MSEETSSSGCMKALGVMAVLGLIGLVLCAAGGTYLYLNREKLGLPSVADLRAQAAEGEATQVTMGGGGDAAPVERPIVASVPKEGTAASFAEWTRREDVLVLVDYYADW